MSWFVRFLYLARVPLLTLLVLGLIGPIGLYFAPQTVIGLLDMDHSSLSLALLSLTTFLIEASAITNINLIIVYGPHRFPDLPLVRLNLIKQAIIRAVILFIATIPSTFLVVYAAQETSLSLVLKVTSIAAGIASAILIVAIATVLKAKFSSMSVTTGASASLVFPIAIDLRTRTAIGP